MSRDQGVIIAKRSVSLSKTYPIIGVALTFLGLLISSLSGVISEASPKGLPPSANATVTAAISNGLPFLAVPLQALAALLFATPVLLLFVYDKNNGVLEYLLSLGMNQRDVYRQYLKASLMLAVGIVSFDVIVDTAAGLIQRTVGFMLEISGLVVVIALSAVSFGSLLMMSFSSLQKQRVGSNQPLGMAIGVFVVLPSYLLPFVVPSIAFWVDLLLAGVIVGLSLLVYSLAGRFISREKLLP